MFWRMTPSTSRLVVALLCVAVVGGAGYWWWQGRQAEAPPAPTARPAPPQLPASSVAAAPGIAHPIEEQADAGKLPDLAHSDKLLRDELTNLLGKDAVSDLLQTDGFVHRAAATIDNLGREHAPASLWPVQPIPDRFTVEEQADGPYLAPGNAQRYGTFVAFVTRIDAGKAASLYKRLYPLFQAAYEELGFPGKYFNDRVVAVIDSLLQAPEPDGPLKLSLTQVQGPIPSTRPWVRYQFADPALEALPAGQKILIRVGPQNARALKAKLRELRAQIARAPGGK